MTYPKKRSAAGISAVSNLGLYMPLVNTWRIYDTSGERRTVVARADRAVQIIDPATWARIDPEASA